MDSTSMAAVRASAGQKARGNSRRGLAEVHILRIKETGVKAVVWSTQPGTPFVPIGSNVA
jgi:hypothetical protein